MPFRRSAAALLFAVPLAALTGCAVPASEPAPPRPAAPAPRPAPPPVMPTTSDWRDWPLTPGTWSYRRTAAGSEAVYGQSGQAVFALSCGDDRQLRIVRSAGGTGSLTIRTTSTARTLPAGTVVLPANDPLFDAMGFSRGRFVVEQAGSPPLVLPAWAEILRVTEDCRG